MTTKPLDNVCVAVFDDNPVNRERLSDCIRSQGGEPIEVSPRAPSSLNLLEDFYRLKRVSLIACDHRLFDGNYANYYGAQAVAESYRHGRGGVLITAYENYDADHSIREYRRWIPVLLHATDIKPSGLGEALLQADREVRQHLVPQHREPFRTIMTIKQLIPKGNATIVKVVMSQWNPHVEVGFPLNMVPKEMQASVSPGNMLIAQVNICAARAEDLYFDQFELPDPNALRKSKAFFNNP
jgi:hypothetical protein